MPKVYENGSVREARPDEIFDINTLDAPTTEQQAVSFVRSLAMTATTLTDT